MAARAVKLRLGRRGLAGTGIGGMIVMKAAVRIGKGLEHEMRGSWVVRPCCRSVATGFAGSEEAAWAQVVRGRR